MQVILQRNKDKYLRRGYPWVFRNQIGRVEGEPATGSVVKVVGGDGSVFGQGLYHRDSQIAVRFVTPDVNATVDGAFFAARLVRAIEFRQRVFPDTTHARLVYGESDGIPGTIIDRYDNVLTWSSLSFGIEQHRELLLDTLSESLKPAAIVERNDNALRAKDGLAESIGVLRGECPPRIRIAENEVEYHADILSGPKTGFFIDQRFHRKHIRRYARGTRVLDVFTSDGGFGLQAAHAGALHVDCVDTSAAALERARHNAEANNVADRVDFHKADALQWLATAAEEDARRYGLVILDPPAFAKRRRDLEDAERAYQSININALRLLDDDGILATSSCSQALSEEAFVKLVRYSAKRAGRSLRLLYRGCQPPDHPVLDSMPETGYLKFFVFQAVRDQVPAPPAD
jgi:23S rRNA (cytosine1962-C5)-methyltransferase